MPGPHYSRRKATPLGQRLAALFSGRNKQAKSSAGTGADKRLSLLVGTGIPVLLALAGGVAIAFWVRGSGPPAGIEPRVPEPARARPVTPSAPGPQAPGQPSAAPPGAPGPSPPSAPAGTTVTTGAVAANVPGFWPQFRGPNRDGVSPERMSLARSWPAQGPAVLWSVNLGEGYAMPAVANGRCYLLDYDHAAQADVLRCLSFGDGKEIWRFSYPAAVKRNHGMSRTQPAVSGNYVVAIGPLATVTCADAQSGKVYWQVDLVKQYGTKVPPWYVGQCPLIEGNNAILAPGGKALMVALDLASGKVVWQTPNPQGWEMTHSSIMPMTVGGTKMYVYPASGGVVGVSAQNGKLLWQFPGWRVPTANVPSPVPIGDGRVFLCGGYNSGSIMLRIKGSGGKFGVEEVFRLPTSTFGSQQMTPILYQGHLYGVREGGELVCLDLNGKIVWSSGPQHRFGIGPYTIANGLLYVMNDNGVLSLVEASPAGYKQLAQAKVLNGSESWGPLVITGGRLLCRDLTRLVCLNVSG